MSHGNSSGAMRNDPDDWDYCSALERNAYIHVIPRIEMIQRIEYRKSSIKPPSLISPPLPLPQSLFFTKKLTVNVD